MTHDELLVLVTGGTNHKMAEEHLLYRKALRAVMELHKPAVNLEFPYQPICRECANLIDPWGENTYPCPTIQAIEKELK